MSVIGVANQPVNIRPRELKAAYHGAKSSNSLQGFVLGSDSIPG